MAKKARRKATARPHHSDDIAEAVRVAQVATIINLRFTEFSAQTELPSREALGPDVSAGIRFTRPRVERKAADTFVVHLDLIFALLRHGIGDHTDPEPIARIHARTEVTYSAVHGDGKPFDDDALQQFTDVNVPFNCWPYWRELAQSTLARLQVEAPVLPLLKLQEISRYRLNTPSE